ncbi:MAG: hypothetical protein ACW981_17875 [Candidatus Hodarchaeales archaeon]|jgi:hypothetical protein
MGFYPYPLGLPRGTVRATVTLLFLFSTAYLILFDKTVPESLISTFTILCALYYGMRKEIIPRSEILDEKKKEKGETAFNLPAFTVRITIFMIFILLAVKILYFGTTTDGFSTFLYKIIYIIAGFIFGTILAKIGGIFGNDPEKQNFIEKLFFHGKAVIIILLCLIVNYFYITEVTNNETAILEVITSLFIGFYFGNR